MVNVVHEWPLKGNPNEWYLPLEVGRRKKPSEGQLFCRNPRMALRRTIRDLWHHPSVDDLDERLRLSRILVRPKKATDKSFKLGRDKWDPRVYL